MSKAKRKTQTRQEIFDEALALLDEARNRMMFLADTASDWTAKIELDEEFKNVRQVCRDFGRHQLGVKVK